jgi:hypothetical protein
MGVSMERYVARPVAVMAAQWDGSLDQAVTLVAVMGACGTPGRIVDGPEEGTPAAIALYGGDWFAYPGDWIMKTKAGLFTIMSPDEFERTFEHWDAPPPGRWQRWVDRLR